MVNCYLKNLTQLDLCNEYHIEGKISLDNRGIKYLIKMSIPNIKYLYIRNNVIYQADCRIGS